MRRRAVGMAAAGGAVLLAGAALLHGQVGRGRQERIPLSQLGTVGQELAGTRIDLTYRRPVARGRRLFGALVPYGRVWTPSADSAAYMTLSGPVEVNGSELPAGTYSIWTIPDSAAWTVIFSDRAHVFHLYYPRDHDVLRVTSAPVRGDWFETLTFTFPVADADSAVLQLRWGDTVVPLKLRAGG